MNRTTGQAIDGTDHLAQSIADILLTPYGSLIGLREYGSRLFDLLDAPVNAATRVLLYAAVATALMRWEPRISIQRVLIAATDAKAGQFLLTVSGTVVDTGAATSIAVAVTASGASDA